MLCNQSTEQWMVATTALVFGLGVAMAGGR